MFRAFHYCTLMAGSLAHAVQRPLQGKHDAVVPENYEDARISTKNDNSAFAGITTYGLLPHLPCLKDESVAFDIATIGSYFDT
ncbi:agmatinase [Colletotrichum kahawae]|uniref:Agmatinase n=1 Tax=Colletotrichum kahawae TaxID=34407 RepID=A0AAD9XWJ3_COLKA|nr:agmatinase [Colletotrichum kahawae]